MSVGVRVRFEVFKRDRFTCAYCGRTPPEILLELDHIVPRAAGGSDEIPNLTTSCADCNRGKGAGLLEEGTQPVVSRATVEELSERLEQAKAYMELLGGFEGLLDNQVGMVNEAWARAFEAETKERADGSVVWHLEGYQPWPEDKSIRRVLRSLSLAEVLEAVDIAAAKMSGHADIHAVRYFFGICYRAIREGSGVGSQRRPVEPSYADGVEAGQHLERERIHDLLVHHEENGFPSLADALAAMWPDDD